MEECIHLLQPETCSSCKGGKTKKDYRFHDELVLVPIEKYNPGFAKWWPYAESYGSKSKLPKNAGWVHIVGVATLSHVEKLLVANDNITKISMSPSLKGNIINSGILEICKSPQKINPKLSYQIGLILMRVGV